MCHLQGNSVGEVARDEWGGAGMGGDGGQRWCGFQERETGMLPRSWIKKEGDILFNSLLKSAGVYESLQKAFPSQGLNTVEKGGRVWKVRGREKSGRERLTGAGGRIQRNDMLVSAVGI